MKNTNLSIAFLLFAVIIVSSSGCAPKRYQDIANSVASQSLLTQEGEYRAVAWLDENRIAFVYKPRELVQSEQAQDIRIGIFELSSGKTKDMTLPDLPSFCLSE